MADSKRPSDRPQCTDPRGGSTAGARLLRRTLPLLPVLLFVVFIASALLTSATPRTVAVVPAGLPAPSAPPVPALTQLFPENDAPVPRPPIADRTAPPPPVPVLAGANTATIPPPWTNIVLKSTGDGPVPVPQAWVSGGADLLQTDEAGRFTLPGTTTQATIIMPGYWPARVSSDADIPIVLQPLEVRAVFLPYEKLWDDRHLQWAIDLADAGTITAIVIDVKEEGGGVLPLIASAEAQEIGSVVDPGTDIAAFLQALADRGIYRIARFVTFLDGRFARAHPEAALLTRAGAVFVDGSGLSWLDPADPAARAYNIELAANAATLFDEVQFDYIRYPGNPRLRVNLETTPNDRTMAVTDFAAAAASAVHRGGAAVSFDLFGQTTVVTVEDSIGQVWEELAAHADYLSPMVYPSTWPAGRFGFAYPPAAPGGVVRASLRAGVERLAGFTAHVRPWLQDFHDYKERRLRYGPLEVQAQIDAALAVGADGFMLWDPSLNYAVGVLAALSDRPAEPR